MCDKGQFRYRMVSIISISSMITCPHRAWHLLTDRYRFYADFNRPNEARLCATTDDETYARKCFTPLQVQHPSYPSPKGEDSKKAVSRLRRSILNLNKISAADCFGDSLLDTAPVGNAVAYRWFVTENDRATNAWVQDWITEYPPGNQTL